MLAIDFYPVGGEIADQAITFEDKFNILAKDGHADDIYGMIAQGQGLSEVAMAMGMSVEDLNLILTRTPLGQHKMMSARLHAVSTRSLAPLTEFASADWLESEQSAAVKHHKDMVSMSMKSTAELGGVNKPAQQATQVIVHSNVTIGTNAEPPPLPIELQGSIIDA